MRRRLYRMQEQLKNLEVEAVKQIETAETVEELQEIQVRYLGRRGSITEVLRGMGKLCPEERPVIGQLANTVRGTIESTLKDKRENLELEILEKKLEEETIDVTLPGKPVQVGAPHLLTSIIEEIEDLFIGLGYEVREGPEVETDYYNFEALNLPKGH